jgi:hypothetical protein
MIIWTPKTALPTAPLLTTHLRIAPPNAVTRNSASIHFISLVFGPLPDPLLKKPSAIFKIK